MADLKRQRQSLWDREADAIPWTWVFLAALVMGLTIAGVLAESPAANRRPAPAALRLDLNTASLEELDSLPGIGLAMAKAILAARPFNTVEELERLRGIGPAALNRLRPLVRASQGRRAAENH